MKFLFFFSFLPLSPLLRYFAYHYFRPFNPLPPFSSKDKNRYFFGCFFFFLYMKITYLFFLLSFKNRFTSYSTSSAKRLPCRLIYQNDDGVASTTVQQRRRRTKRYRDFLLSRRKYIEKRPTRVSDLRTHLSSTTRFQSVAAAVAAAARLVQKKYKGFSILF